MSENNILDAVFDLKGDVGNLQSSVTSLRIAVDAHTAASTVAHARILALEIAAARAKGVASVWLLIATAAGSLLGFMSQVAIQIFSKWGNH